jgi:23S rRNA (cytidine1920-2'-O)/16S rRNA (cytidine1409-2'-O)-methyltransferase
VVGGSRQHGGRGKQRLDERLVTDGLAETRSRAQALILSGAVLVDDMPIDKAGTRVRDESTIRLRGGQKRFVSRGGEKLAGALDELGLSPQGLFCMDVGASTGGFTDCLLQAGATGVLAVDVGHGQLHERLRQDERVVVLERTNARDLRAEQIPQPPGLIVADVSFISLRLLMERFARVAPGADWLLMVKPQFEVGRGKVGKGGVVRDDEDREEAVLSVVEDALDHGYRLVGRADSRLAGPKGNREIFVHLRAGRGGRADPPRAGKRGVASGSR